MDAEDSFVWDMVAMVGTLPDDNRGASRDIRYPSLISDKNVRLPNLPCGQVSTVSLD